MERTAYKVVTKTEILHKNSMASSKHYVIFMLKTIQGSGYTHGLLKICYIHIFMFL